MECVITWDADAWAALGTWVTGAAAATVAWFAYRFSSNVNAREASANERRSRAYSIAAFVELSSAKERATHVKLVMLDAINDASVDKISVAMRTIAAVPPFTLSPWVFESPTLGDLPEEVGVAVAHAVAAASDAERARSLIATMSNSIADAHPDNLLEGGRSILMGAMGGLIGLEQRTEEAARLIGFRVGLVEQVPAPETSSAPAR